MEGAIDLQGKRVAFLAADLYQESEASILKGRIRSFDWI
jgi:hypothetical protein